MHCSLENILRSRKLVGKLLQGQFNFHYFTNRIFVISPDLANKHRQPNITLK